MDYKSLVLLVVIHVVFDFLLQSREVAKNKSSNWRYLVPHLYILFIGLQIYAILSGRYTGSQGILFAILNTLAHGIIDWTIWKVYKFTVWKRTPAADMTFPYWEDKMFYNFIAFDQALHALCYIGLDYFVRSL